MDNPKQTMFLIPPGISWPNAFDLHALVPQGYMPNIAQSFEAAKVLIDMGIAIAIIYPFSIPWNAYTFQDTQMNPIYSGGYCFWQQELEAKQIPTIVVDLNILGSDWFLHLKSLPWKDKTFVRFFRHDELSPNWDELVALIKLF
ncbi:MAG: hypothetical protein NTX91_02235 [candidate division SR1 bacterium]|nr:hypothetical protein [candidate division SR1 bacterium]